MQTIAGLSGNSVELVVQPLNVMSYNDCAGNMSAQPNAGIYRLSREQLAAPRVTCGPRFASEV